MYLSNLQWISFQTRSIDNFETVNPYDIKLKQQNVKNDRNNIIDMEMKLSEELNDRVRYECSEHYPITIDIMKKKSKEKNIYDMMDGYEKEYFTPTCSIQTLLESGGTQNPDGSISGGNKVLAMHRAMDIINWQKHGTSGKLRILSQVVPFMNAYIQGMDVLIGAIRGKAISGTAKKEAQALFLQTAIKIAAILNEYDKNIIRDAAQIRTYVTNKLIELSNSGNPRDELRALELLGKVSDVGLFVEKSEIQIKHTSSDSLEQIIKDKINRILGRENVEIEDAIYEEELEEESDEEDEEVIDNSDTDDE